MSYKLKLFPVLVFLLMMSSCSQSENTQYDADSLIGKWKTTEATSFRGKEVEFFPDHQVTLTLANAGKPVGQYETHNNTIIFSIGDAPPFKMNFRFEDDKLILISPEDNAETRYQKEND